MTLAPALDFDAVAYGASNIDVLRRIADTSRPFPSIQALCDEISKDRSNTGKLLKALADDGLLAKDDSPFGYAVTPAGSRAIFGIEAAAGEITPDPDALLLRVDQMRLNPLNPRKTIVESEVGQMLDNICDRVGQGLAPLIANLLVYPADAEGIHTLHAGEKRWRAVTRGVAEGRLPEGILLAAKVQVIDKTQEAAQVAWTAVSENQQRSNLSLIEEAEAYKTIADSSGLDGATIARRLGRDVKTVQEMLKIMREAKPEALADHRAGALKWEELRDSVKLIRLTPEQVLIVLELLHRQENDEPAASGGDGPDWVEVSMIPSVGPALELIEREILEVRNHPDTLARVRSDRPRVQTWLEAQGWERNPVEALWKARMEVLGSFQAAAVEKSGALATEWANPRPLATLTETLAEMETTTIGVDLSHATDLTAVAVRDAETGEVRVLDEDEAAEVLATAVKTPDVASPLDKLILVEIAHKTRGITGYTVPQGEGPEVHACEIAGAAAEITDLCWRGWAQRLAFDGKNLIRVTEPGERQLAPNGLMGVNLDTLLQDVRKAAGLSNAERLKLSQTRAYSFKGLNTAPADPARDLLDGAELKPIARLALIELAHKIQHHGIEPAGRGYRGAEVFDYSNHKVCQELLHARVLGFGQHPKGGWLAYLTPRGKDVLQAWGACGTAVRAEDLATAFKAAEIAEMPRPGEGYASAFLNPSEAKPAVAAPRAVAPAVEDDCKLEITNPGTISAFRGMLTDPSLAAPWSWLDGDIVSVTGLIVCTVPMDVGLFIVVAVNTCAGFKAVVGPDQ